MPTLFTAVAQGLRKPQELVTSHPLKTSPGFAVFLQQNQHKLLVAEIPPQS